jgi:hypothetical protein
MPGKIRGIVAGRGRVYERLKGKYGKTRAAKIANAGKTHKARSAMSRKAARTRKRR